MKLRASLVVVLLAGLTVTLPIRGIANAAEPTIRSLDVRGLQIGGKTTLTIDGSDLLPSPQVLLPFPAAKIELRPGATASRAVFDVELPADIVAGTYQLRVATEEGVTGPMVIGVDRLRQLAVVPQIKDPLPVALHGSVSGSVVTETRFSGKSGEQILVEVEAVRLGSKLRPVVHLLDTSRKQLAWSWPQRTLAGDTRLETKLPQDGEYIVQLHDAEYQAPAPSYYRLKIGSWHFAETTFPAAVSRNKSTSLELIGNMPNTRVDVKPLAEQVIPAPWPSGAIASGPRISVLVSDIPEILEAPPSPSPQEITSLPAAISGRLMTAGEKDVYQVAVMPGQKIKIEVFAERLGAPLDPVLLVQDEKGASLARGDDSPGTVDPVLEYTVPDKRTSITLAIQDLLGRGGSSSIYRIVLTNGTETGNAARDFRAFALSEKVRVPRQASTLLPITVQRKGYEGPIRITAQGLPAGTKLANNVIPAQSEGVLLEIKNDATANMVSLFSLSAASEDNSLVREVVFEQHPLGDQQPWLRNELAASLSSEQKLAIDWVDIPTHSVMTLAGKLKLPIRLIRPEGEAGAVRLSLLTAQIVPKVNNAPDPNQTIRVEKAVEVAPDKSDGELVVLVPVALAGPLYDVAVMAELLSKDKKSVVATAVTSPRQFPTQNPLKIQLANASTEAKLDTKGTTTVKVSGKIERLIELKGAVTIAATGLPAGVRAANVVVKAEESNFEFLLIFPAKSAAGEVTEISLIASTPPDAARPNALLRTKEIPLKIKLTE